MKHAVVVCVLLLSGLGRAQKTGWPVVVVNQHFSIAFPSRPDEMDVPRTMAAAAAPNLDNPRMLASRAFRSEDESGVYVLVCVPLNETPELPLTPTARAAYYKVHTIPLFIRHARGQLLSQDINSLAGYDVITLTYRALGATGSPTVKFFRQVIVGRTIYQLYFVPADKIGATSTAQQTRFFNSIRIKP